jgi:hypothetical protein
MFVMTWTARAATSAGPTTRVPLTGQGQHEAKTATSPVRRDRVVVRGRETYVVKKTSVTVSGSEYADVVDFRAG